MIIGEAGTVTAYPIKEYGSFIADKKAEGYGTLPERTFEQLENFILTNRNRETDALELMGLSARRGVGKIITAKNYVGLIAMNDGTTIEILPKVFSAVDDDPSNRRTKRLLVDMLKTLRNAPFKSLQISGVNIEKMNIFEVFIRMFIDEVFLIVKRGLKRGYETVEENAAFFRGKMKFSQQIRQNHAHQERSYVEYDRFTANRPENRLLKAALQYLYRRSASSKNRNDIRILLDCFAAVEASSDYRGDFSKYTPDRNMKDYTTALLWSRVFLTGRSFASYAGSEVALALLFPMETLFESYIAALLKKKLDKAEFSVSTQDKRYHLFDRPRKEFRLRPDIVVTRRADGAVFVMDTKWKILPGAGGGCGISQADMYQMYAYQKKYGAEDVTLLYPKTEKLPSTAEIPFQSDDGVTVRACFVDLFDVQNSLSNIARHFSPRPFHEQRSP